MNIDKLVQSEDGTYRLDGNLTSRDVLRRLEENDPTTKAVKFWTTPCIGAESFQSDKDIEQVGRALAQNTNVETLTLCIHFGVGIDRRMIRLLQWLKENRGIRHFELTVLRKVLDIEMDIFSQLGPFFERNETLESIVLKNLHLSPQGDNPLLDSLARRQSPLHKIEVWNIGGNRAKEMLLFFKVNPETTPKRIAMKGNRLGDEECFCISDIIINAGNELEEIDLGNNRIGPRGLQSISQALIERDCSLQRLDLSTNNVNDDHIFCFVEEFFSHPDLIPNQLDLKINDIGLEGFEKLGNVAVRRSTPLTLLDLSGNEVGMRGIQPLLGAFLAHPHATPKDLRLGLRGLYSILKEEIPLLLKIPACSLEKLFITNQLNRGEGPLTDESAKIIAISLISNSTLMELRTLTGSLSENGWKHFYSLLCDTSSIRSTYESNHILTNLGSVSTQPPNIRPLLKLNNNPDKNYVATVKIIHHHFAHNFDCRLFEDMKPSLLVQVFSFINRGFPMWIENDFRIRGPTYWGSRTNHLVVNFLILKNLPTMFECLLQREKAECLEYSSSTEYLRLH